MTANDVMADKTFADYCRAIGHHERRTGWRRGQIAFNLLSAWRPKLADLVRGRTFDPFYAPDTEPLNEFFAWVKQHWGDAPRPNSARRKDAEGWRASRDHPHQLLRHVAETSDSHPLITSAMGEHEVADAFAPCTAAKELASTRSGEESSYALGGELSQPSEPMYDAAELLMLSDEAASKIFLSTYVNNVNAMVDVIHDYAPELLVNNTEAKINEKEETK